MRGGGTGGGRREREVSIKRKKGIDKQEEV